MLLIPTASSEGSAEPRCVRSSSSKCAAAAHIDVGLYKRLYTVVLRDLGLYRAATREK